MPDGTERSKDARHVWRAQPDPDAQGCDASHRQGRRREALGDQGEADGSQILMGGDVREDKGVARCACW